MSEEITGYRGMVSIPDTRYQQLLEAEAMLQALEAAGVDNWPGYSDAQEMMEENDVVDEG